MWDWTSTQTAGTVGTNSYTTAVALFGGDAVLGYEFNIAHKPNVNWQQEQKLYAYLGGEQTVTFTSHWLSLTFYLQTYPVYANLVDNIVTLKQSPDKVLSNIEFCDTTLWSVFFMWINLRVRFGFYNCKGGIYDYFIADPQVEHTCVMQTTLIKNIYDKKFLEKYTKQG